MRIQASAGPDKRKDLRDYCYKLTLTVDRNLPRAGEEAELLSRLYREFSQGNAGYLLRTIRKWQLADERKAKDEVRA